MTRAARRRLRGIAASPGVAVGPAVLLESRRLPVPRRRLADAEVEPEVTRLHDGLRAARSKLRALHAALPEPQREAYGLILEAHRLLLEDPMLWTAAERAIRAERIGAAWAVRRTLDHFEDRLGQAESPYLRERCEDLEHVGRLLLGELLGEAAPGRQLPAGAVLVADDLSPAEAARLLSGETGHIVALAIERGSTSSHTALLARAHALPAVVGCPGLLAAVDAGERIVVDGLRGEVLLRPDEDEVRSARDRGRRYASFHGRLRAERPTEPAVTLDGARICLLVNVEWEAEADAAVREGADGVGLFRTEFLFLGRREPPDEEEQLRRYRAMLRAVAPRPVVLRTVDLGADKLLGAAASPGAAGAPGVPTGLRGLRLVLHRPELWRAQLRAMLRAAAEGPLRLLLPMVGGPEELRAARAAISSAAEQLAVDGLEHRVPPVGVMVEVPSAALRAEALAAEADFLSVGSNDLVQYTLAAPRDEPAAATFADPLDPAIVELLDRVAAAARRHGRPLTLCGDLAADLHALPLLLGLGYRHLSVPVASLPLVRAVVRRLRLEQAEQVAREAPAVASAAQVRDLLQKRFGPHLGEMWAEQYPGSAEA